MIVSVPNPGVWGWPWHGLATAGVVAGKSITQPQNGNSWLIDIGIPAISLTATEIAEAIANGYEWHNYALISGGRLYDTELTGNRYIHVDADNVCWLIHLIFGYTAENQIDITAYVKRFGLFGFGEQSQIALTTSVTCTHIELTEVLGNPIGSYINRRINIQDVWTNGGKCLVGVILEGGTVRDLFSVVEISLSGSGGATGSGLSLSAVEVIGQPDLTVQHSANGIWDGINEGAGIGYQWYGTSGTGFGGGFDLLQDRDVGGTYARTCYYNAAGNLKVLKLRVRETADHWLTSTSAPTERACIFCSPMLDAYVTAEGEFRIEIAILENNDVIDHLSAVSTATATQRQMRDQQLTNMVDYLNGVPGAIYGAVTDLCCNGYFYAFYEYLQTDYIWDGSLAAFYDQPAAETMSTGDLAALTASWRSVNDHMASSNTAIGAQYLGLQRIDAKAAALYHSSTSSGVSRTYGLISTPTGPLTYSGGTAPTTDLYFAWQRKTGDFAFSTSPICYV